MKLEITGKPEPYSARSDVVREASLQLRIFVLKLRKKHDLTPSEVFRMLGSEISALASSCLTMERRGTSDDPDWAGI